MTRLPAEGTRLGPGSMAGARLAADGTVARAAGPWTPTVHAWLRHLTARGVRGVPVPLAVDPGTGVEHQERLPGEPGWHPPHARVRDEASLGELVAWLGEVHAAADSFTPDHVAVWNTGPRPADDGEVVLHGDLGPWNTLWDDRGLTGVVDWDLAEPGPAWWDVANLVWGFVPVTPLRPPASAVPGDGAARTDRWVPDQPRRLAALGEGLGRTPAELLTAVVDWLDLQLARRTTDVPPGPFWRALATRTDDIAGLRAQRAWLDGGPGPFA